MLTYRNNFADLLRAVDALAITEPVAQVAVARMLGLRATIAVTAPATLPWPTEQEQQPEAEKRKTTLTAVGQPSPPRKNSIDPRDDAWLEPLRSAGTSLPDWFDKVQAFPDQEMTPQHAQGAIEPLFRAQWLRTLIYEALCTKSPTGEIDIDRVIAMLADARPMASWPRRQRRRLNRGVQVLVDYNESMRPYALDQSQLLGRIREIVGREIVQAIPFIGCPNRVLKADGVGDSAYQPPPPATPILILTDFGVSDAGIRGQDASLSEWLEFLATGREAGFPIIAFTPYQAERIPNSIRQCISVVKWDRFTTTAIVRRLRDDAGFAQ